MICAIILASGNSTRFNSEIPKQFHKLNGHMLLDYPIQTFSECSEIDRLIIVVPENYCSEIQEDSGKNGNIGVSNPAINVMVNLLSELLK